MIKQRISKPDVYFVLAYFLTDLFVFALESIGSIPTLYGPAFGLSAAYACAKGFKALPIIAFSSVFIHTPILLLHTQNISISGVLTIAIGVLFTSLLFGFMFAKYFHEPLLKERFLNDFSKVSVKFIAITSICCIPPAIISMLVMNHFGEYSLFQTFSASARFVFGIFIAVIILAPTLTILFNNSLKKYITIHHFVIYALSTLSTTGAIYFVEVTNNEHLDRTFQNHSKSIDELNQTNIIGLVDSLRQLRNNLHLYTVHDEDRILREFSNSKKNSTFIKKVFLANEISFTEKAYTFNTFFEIPIGKDDDLNDFRLLTKKTKVSESDFSKLTAFFEPLQDSRYVTLFLPYERAMTSGSFNANIVGILIDFDAFLKSSLAGKDPKYLDLLSASFLAEFKLNSKTIKHLTNKISNIKNVTETDSFNYNSTFKYINFSLAMHLSMPPIPWRAGSATFYWWLLFIITIFHIGLTRLQFYLISRDMEFKKSVLELKSEIALRKIAQKEINNLNCNLESRVKDRTNQLSERKKDLESILKIIPDALVKVNVDGKIIKLETQSGKSLNINALLENKIYFSSCLKNIDAQLFKTLLLNTIDTDKVHSHVFELNEYDNILYCELTFSKFNSETSLIMLRDVTEKHKLHKQIEMQNIQALNHARLASLGEMAAGIAHEINNPLTIIDGSAQILSKLIDPNATSSNDKANKALLRINRTVSRIAAIVNGLKKFTRENKQEFEKISLNSFLDESLSFCRERFSNHGVPLLVDIETEQKFIYCNPIELSQVLVNLLNNAFDAIKNSDEKWVKVSIKENENSLIISIMDSGPGIAEDIQSKIMQPFYTTKAIGQGTGLGLSISQGIVKAHSGSLSYETKNEHTCFIIEIPKDRLRVVAS